MSARIAGLCVFVLIVLAHAAMAQVPPSSPPPQIQISAAVMESRLAQAALDVAREGTVTPIPLDTGGAVTHGVIYDRFQLGVIAAKAAIKAGRTPSTDISGMGRGFVPTGIAIVAYALRCEGRSSAPQDIRLTVRLGSAAPPQEMRAMTITPSAASLLPGVDLPPASRVMAFPNAPLVDATVSIDYAEPLCPGEQKTVELPVRTVSTRATTARPTVQLPASLSTLPSPTVVRLQTLVDLDGTPRQPLLVQGPPELEAAAVEAFKQWRFEPSRTNGAPVVQLVVWPLTFTSTGNPPAPTSTGSRAPGDPATPARPPAAAGPASIATNDQPGLSSATSKCPVADDETYATTAANAIHIAAGADVVTREEQFMRLLRGPDGKGLRFRRTGAMLAPDQKTVVDVFEVTYGGLAQPIRVHFDRTQSDTLKAPKGWACTAGS